MKYFCSKILTAIAIVSATTAAFSQNLNQYGSTLQPLTSNTVNSKLHPPTDITVMNASAGYIYVMVPNSPVYDFIRPGPPADHIYNYDPSIAFTNIVLQDPYRNTFYSAYVCRLALITVFGSMGNYSISYDDDLCR